MNKKAAEATGLVVSLCIIALAVAGTVKDTGYYSVKKMF